MKIDELRLRGAIHMHTQRGIAEKMGISQPSLNAKLKDLYRLRFKEFLAICDAMGERPEIFIIMEDEKEKAALVAA